MVAAWDFGCNMVCSGIGRGESTCCTMSICSCSRLRRSGDIAAGCGELTIMGTGSSAFTAVLVASIASAPAVEIISDEVVEAGVFTIVEHSVTSSGKYGLRRSISCGLGPDTGRLRRFRCIFKSETFIFSRREKSVTEQVDSA